MKKIGLAGFIHETNTFSNTPTPLDNFVNQSGFYPELMQGEEIFQFKEGRVNIAASGFMRKADELDLDVVPLVWCGTEPSQTVPQDVFDTIMGWILAALKENAPYDGLYLDLHGAMVFGDLQDGETEILRQVRAVVGKIPIVASLDLHGNITRASFELADALVGYRTYPHVDGYEAGERSAVFMRYLMDGKPLYKAFRQSPFLMPATTQPTTIEPAKSLYGLIPEVESRKGVFSASIMEGFNACDLPDTGPSIFTYAEDQVTADNAADFLLDAMLEREAQFSVNMYAVDDAVKKAKELAKTADGPVLLIDVQDNAGGGSPSDTVWLLEELVAQDVRDAAVGVIWDPEAAAIAHEAGEGAEVEIAVGGKSLPGQEPFVAKFKVETLFEGDFVGVGPMVKNRRLNLGKMAQLRYMGVRVAVSTERMQALDRSLFQTVGIEPAEMKVLVLKSANHYRADFGPIASEIINVDAPSAIIEDPVNINYLHLREGVRLKGLGPEYKRP
ncbi:MAG: M81 family metallopeptidase [Chloroflexota bacterium]|nr:M81 family metallopeptidase [Chloroflexota bacterium]